MNLKTVLFAVLITVALVSAAPIQVDETEVAHTFPDSESNGEVYDETFDESGHPIQSAKRDASELTTESQFQDENKPTTTDDNSSEENANESRKAFNSDMLNVVIGAVDGAVDVALGAVTGAVDVALGTVTGAANVAAGTVTGAVGVISGTVDGTLGVISGIAKPTKQVAPATTVYQPALPRPAHPQLAYPGHPVMSRPIVAQAQSNIVGTPPGPIMSNAVVRESINMDTAETKPIISEEEIAATGAEIKPEVAPVVEEIPSAQTKPIISEEEIAATGAEINPMIAKTMVYTIETTDTEAVPEVLPIVIEEIAQTKPIISEEEIAASNAEIKPIATRMMPYTIETADMETVPEVSPVMIEEMTPAQTKPIISEEEIAATGAEIKPEVSPVMIEDMTPAQIKPIISEEEVAATGAEIKPIMAKTIVDTEMPMNDVFTVGTSMSVDNTAEIAPEVSSVIVEAFEEMAQTKPIIGEEEIAATGAQIKPIAGSTPMVAPVISEPIIMNIEDKFTPIITGQMMADEPTVDMTNTEEMAAPINTVPADVAETSDDVTDDVARDKRMPHDHDHGHEQGDCDDHSSHEKDE